MTARRFGWIKSVKQPARKRIAFLAISQAHQFLHWLPAALRLAERPEVEVTVLVSSRAGLDFIRSYDPERRLRIKRLWAPSLRRHGLFTPPKRRSVLLLNAWSIARYPTIVTSEVTSSLLNRIPGFRSQIIQVKHGAGDREGGYKAKHASFDLTLVSGPKDRQRMIERKLATEENCIVTGCGKFEFACPSPAPLFRDDRPIALYNPHFDKEIGSWVRHGRDVMKAIEKISGWNFVVAPHVKLRRGPPIRSSAPNILIDRGSIRSIDMTYTQSAHVYIGDASSQVYEFVRTPRPCIFLNLDRIDWRSNPAYMHWHFGQVIESMEEFPAALSQALAFQPRFEQAQLSSSAASIDETSVPASVRQAQAIFCFAAQA